jgi:hypothetical protein
MSRAGQLAGFLFSALLCLPSLVGGASLLLEMALHENIGQWTPVASALIALGALLGGPLVAVAAVVGGISAWSRSASNGLKFAHLTVVGAAAISTLSLLLRFGR